MLFAEADTVPGWAYFVFGTVATGLAGAAAWYLKWDQNRRKELRRDNREDHNSTLKEYRDLLDLERRRCDEALERLQKRVDSQDSYIKSLLEESGEAKRSEAEQKGKVNRLEIELQHVIQELRSVQAVTGKFPPGVTMPCQIIADQKGIVKWASGSSMDMFGWLPQELIGRNITVLMPKDVAPLHRRALELLVKENRKIDPSKLIRGKGVTKLGRTFPVSINLSAAEGLAPGIVYITAEIRRYGDSDSFVELHGPVTPADGMPAVKLEDTVKAPPDPAPGKEQ